MEASSFFPYSQPNSPLWLLVFSSSYRSNSSKLVLTEIIKEKGNIRDCIWIHQYLAFRISTSSLSAPLTTKQLVSVSYQFKQKITKITSISFKKNSFINRLVEQIPFFTFAWSTPPTASILRFHSTCKSTLRKMNTRYYKTKLTMTIPQMVWGTVALIIKGKGKNRIYTMESSGNPEMATLKSAKVSLFDGWCWPAEIWLSAEVLDDGGGNILVGFFPFWDLNHCKQ